MRTKEQGRGLQKGGRRGTCEGLNRAREGGREGGRRAREGGKMKGTFPFHPSLRSNRILARSCSFSLQSNAT